MKVSDDDDEFLELVLRLSEKQYHSSLSKLIDALKNDLTRP